MKTLRILKLFAVLLWGLILFTKCTLDDEPLAPNNTASELNNLSLLQSTHCVKPPSDLIGWWPLDETDGTTAADIFGGIDGIKNGGPTPVNGKVVGALSFDGIDDEVVINSKFQFHQPGDATLEFWLKAPIGGHQGVFWTRPDNDDADRFNIFINQPNNDGLRTFGFDYRETDGTIHELVGGGGCCPAGLGGVPIPADTWTHIAITRIGGDTYKLYINGALEETAIDPSPNLPTATGWQMSGRDGSMLLGSLDEVEIYDCALTQSEIQAIFDAGSVGKCRMVTICHMPGTRIQKTLVIPIQALAGHLSHGDMMGPCE